MKVVQLFIKGAGMSDNNLKKYILETIDSLKSEELSISTIIEHIDYINKIRYTEDEVIKQLIEIIKERKI